MSRRKSPAEPWDWPPRQSAAGFRQRPPPIPRVIEAVPAGRPIRLRVPQPPTPLWTKIAFEVLKVIVAIPLTLVVLAAAYMVGMLLKAW